MSDLNAKSSSDSEMNSSANAKEDSLDLTQQIEEQQQHLVSDYQCQSDMISTSVETGECIAISAERIGLRDFIIADFPM